MPRITHPRSKKIKSTRSNIPVATTSFIGREREISRLKRLLVKTRLLTLTGAGGSGKTRLALEFAKFLSDKNVFRNGVWWVPLAFLSDPELVPQTVAGTLGLSEVSNETFAETLVRSLRDKNLLLVLDNCEHLVGRCAKLANELLSRCPDLKIVTTSREALGLVAEQIFQVPLLSVPDPQQPLTTLKLFESEAMRLFVTRAQAVTPEFTLTDANARAIAQICRKLDGIPLALELAATRVRVLAVEQIAMHLDDRFSLLKAENHSALPRHQTMRATLDWSYELLSPPEKILFRQLSIFAGGWTLEAARAVCSSDELAAHDLIDLLSRLVSKSLVTMHEHEGAARYYLLETIRVYAQDKLLASGEANQLQERHLTFFLKLAAEPTAQVHNWFYNERFLRQRYGVELDNLRVALARSLDGEEIERGAQLAAALLWFWNIGSFMSEGSEWLRLALSFGDRVSRRTRADVLVAAIYVDQRRGRYEEAIAFGQEGVAIYRELKEMPQLARALGFLARAFCDQGDQERAILLAQEAIQLFREHGPENVARVLMTLATARQLRGDFEGSVPVLHESIALAEKYDDENGKIEPLGLLARVYRARGDFGQATRLYNASMAYTWKTGYTFRMAFALEFYAVLATMQRQSERAARLWGAAYALRKANGVPRPASQKDYDEHERNARSQLDEKTYSRLYAEGGAMALEEAVRYAMAAPIPNAADAAPPPPSEETLMRKTAGLTRREYQVAMRVAQGVSNREIAAQLFVSERTIEKHVGNLLSKLHLNSRTQLAAWVLERAWLKHP